MRCLLSLLLLALLAGCAFEPFEGEIETPPLQLRSTIPDDSASFDPATLGVVQLRFNRAAADSEFALDILPPPLDAGRLVPLSGARLWNWVDGELDPRWPVHSFLLTGPGMLRPQVARLSPEGPNARSATLQARVRVPAGNDPADVVLMALSIPASTAFLDSTERWFGQPAHGAGSATAVPHPDGGRIASIPGLPPFGVVVVVAWVEIHGDGWITPGIEPWAIARSESIPAAAGLFIPDPCPFFPGKLAVLDLSTLPLSAARLPDPQQVLETRLLAAELRDERGDDRCPPPGW